jgi:hypothetical protein
MKKRIVESAIRKEYVWLNIRFWTKFPINNALLIYIALFMLPHFFLSILYVVGVLEKYVKRMLDQTDKSVLEFEDCLS